MAISITLWMGSQQAVDSNHYLPRIVYLDKSRQVS